MNSIKQGVKLYGIKPEMSAVDSVVTSIFAKHGIDCVITSGVRPADGKSLHGAGFAYDYRANHIDDIAMRDRILGELEESLPQCDILLHGEGDNIHFHIEHDPKDDALFQADKAFYKQHGLWPKR